MRYLLPPKLSINIPSNRTQRVCNIFKNWHDEPLLIKSAKIGIVGVPFDFGVKVSEGRVGASEAPTAVRAALSKLGTTYFIEHNIDISGVVVLDFGDVDIVYDNPLETYDRISQVINYLLDNSITPITIGGSHDISFATIKGFASHFSGNSIGGINVDAHLDVREITDGIISSGSPFRAALQSIKEFKPEYFTTIGVTTNVNAKSHFQYLWDQDSKIVTLNQFRKFSVTEILNLALSTDSSFLSIDIDVVSQAFAPGCSAPAIVGMSPEEILEIAFIAGRSNKVKMLDIVEVNPLYDQDNCTARLAGLIMLEFIAGREHMYKMINK